MSNKTQGQGNHGNAQQHAEAGKQGGEHSHSTKSHPSQAKEDHRHQDNLSEEQRQEIGRKGGETVSQDREHMAEIGRKGGQHSHDNVSKK